MSQMDMSRGKSWPNDGHAQIDPNSQIGSIATIGHGTHHGPHVHHIHDKRTTFDGGVQIAPQNGLNSPIQ